MLETHPRSIVARPKLIARTKGLPLVGTLPQLLKDPFGFMVRARETYGDVYRLNLGLSDVVILNHPRQIQHVLVDRVHNYRKGGAIWDMARVLLGNGLLVSEGDFWLRQRRMMQPQFHHQRLATSMAGLMVDAIDEALNTWEPAATGKTFDLLPAFNYLTMRVITRILFGGGLIPCQMDEISKAMTYTLEYLLQAMVLNALPAWLPVPGRRRYRQAVSQIDQNVYASIAANRRQNGTKTHLLAILLDAVDEATGEHMTNQQLRNEVTTLFLAGYETTSLALSWAFDYLTHRPEMLQTLQAEVDSVLGGRRPTFDDLPQLAYTRMVLCEALRLRPPSWQLPRIAVQDDEIDGHLIPAGTNVVSLIYTCHRHPDVWPDPERFDPGRFAAGRVEKCHKLAWMPFGVGQRMCIGREFALMEGQLALAMLMQRYQVAPAGERQAEPQLTGTLRPKGGIHVRLTKR